MSFSVAHLLVFLAVVILLFGTKKLRTLGSDLGTAIRGFKKAVQDDEVVVETEKKDDPKLQ